MVPKRVTNALQLQSINKHKKEYNATTHEHETYNPVVNRARGKDDNDNDRTTTRRHRRGRRTARSCSGVHFGGQRVAMHSTKDRDDEDTVRDCSAIHFEEDSVSLCTPQPERTTKTDGRGPRRGPKAWATGVSVETRSSSRWLQTNKTSILHGTQ